MPKWNTGEPIYPHPDPEYGGNGNGSDPPDVVGPDRPATVAAAGSDRYLHGAGMDNPVQSVQWYEAILFANLLSVERGLRPCYYWDEALTILIMEGDISWGNPSCDWAANGYRLPSEGEWERFCRAGHNHPFCR